LEIPYGKEQESNNRTNEPLQKLNGLICVVKHIFYLLIKRLTYLLCCEFNALRQMACVSMKDIAGGVSVSATSVGLLLIRENKNGRTICIGSIIIISEYWNMIFVC
jgi:hypothetical protein